MFMNATVGSWLPQHCRVTPKKTAVVADSFSLTYAELNARANQAGHALLDAGVRRGDRVVVILPNGIPFVELLFACSKIGAVFVPVNYRLSPAEVAYIIADSQPKLVFYYKDFAHLTETARQESPSLPFIATGRNADDPSEYESWMAGKPQTDIAAAVTLDDPHVMMYTSGTTGRPKGAILTHGNTFWNAINSLSSMDYFTDDRFLVPAPMFHIGGLGVHALPGFYKGATIYLEEKFDPVRTLELIQQHQITGLFLVPAMWAALMRVPRFEEYDLRSLRTAVSGGAPCPLTVIEFFQSRNIPFQEGFGLTETAPFVSVLRNEDAVRKNGSIGLPAYHVSCRIVDPDDNDCPVGEVGELVVKGPNVFVGYWNRPEETKQAIRDGWFYTGDLARMDEEGFLYIVDRKKDMIISGGENIYPIEVEQVLYRHPAVLEAAVVGRADETWGEVPVAFVALKPGQSADPKEIIAFCEGKIARFKIPKEVFFVEALPRNATGKILKTVLRTQLTSA
jgi:fatty-acyl-CoA synthase